MNFPLGAILVDPQGQTVVVSVTGPGGVSPSVYADAFGVSPVSMPDTISAATLFYVPSAGPWTVSARLGDSSGQELFGKALTVEAGQSATATCGRVWPTAVANPTSGELLGFDGWQLAAYVPTPADTNQIVYVSKSAQASDSNNGLSLGTPFATVGKAVTVLNALGGGVINLGWGTFTESGLAPLGSPSGAIEFDGCGIGSEIQLNTNNETLIDLTNQQYLVFRDLSLSLGTAVTTGTLVNLNNAFKNNFDKVYFSGQWLTGSATYDAQTGIHLQGNAGDNNFVNTVVFNLGVGCQVDSETNYFTSSKFANNNYHIQGGDPAGVLFVAGISVSSTTFSGTGTAYVNITGTAQSWVFTDCWWDGGATTAIQCGSGTFGPALLSIISAQNLTGQTNSLVLQAASDVVLVGIRFATGGGSPTDLTINTANCPYGFATGIRWSAVFDVASSLFPPGWIYSGRTTRVPSGSAGSKFYPAAIGQWYINPLAIAQRTLAPTLNEARAHLFYSGPNGITIDSVDVLVTAAGTASNARVGLYTVNNQANPFQWATGTAWATLIAGSDTGAIATTTTGQQLFTYGTPVAVPANTWFAVIGIEQGTTAATRQIGGSAGADYPSPFGNGGAQGYGSSPGLAIYAGSVSGAMPATFTPFGTHAQTTDNGVGIHRSA